jgi:hypothetical protein
VCVETVMVLRDIIFIQVQCANRALHALVAGRWVSLSLTVILRHTYFEELLETCIFYFFLILGGMVTLEHECIVNSRSP